LSPPAPYVRNVVAYSSGLPVHDDNPTYDAMLYFLQSYGVDCLDSRAILAESLLPRDLFTFKTDHHWTIDACFEVFRALVSKLNYEYGANLDPDGFYRDISNYNVRRYPKSSLGYLGQQTGAVFSGYDDFTLIWPNFPTEFHREKLTPSGHSEINGPVYDSLLNKDPIKYTSPSHAHDLFGTYTGTNGVFTWSKIINKMNPDGLKLLVIMDSFSLPLVVFLAPLFSEIHTIWPLLEKNRVDIDEYLDKNAFDYVVIEYHSDNINDTFINFFK
jgi:hypothetical protein